MAVIIKSAISYGQQPRQYNDNFTSTGTTTISIKRLFFQVIGSRFPLWFHASILEHNLWGMGFLWFSCYPTISVKALKGTQSTNPNPRPDVILSSLVILLVKWPPTACTDIQTTVRAVVQGRVRPAAATLARESRMSHGWLSTLHNMAKV